MDMERKILRMGAVVILGALLLRLLGSGILETAAQAFAQPEMASAMIFLQTGRLVRLETPAESPPPETTAPTETEPVTVQKEPAAFTAEDASLVDIYSYCSYSVDTASLLTQPLDWDLTDQDPAVLILHTHGSEGYAGTTGYRSTDETVNVVSIGDRLAQLLEAGGIGVVHDRTMHDQPSYNGSYSQARESIESYLAQYPTIRMVLDIHRDAAEDANGNQINYTVETAEGTAAKLMLVVGTDAGGLTHPNWQENMALAVKLHAQLEKLCPDICRPISFRSSRFNQDLSAGAMLIEVGAAGNTHAEALLAADILAQGILSLAYGAQ